MQAGNRKFIYGCRLVAVLFILKTWVLSRLHWKYQEMSAVWLWQCTVINHPDCKKTHQGIAIICGSALSVPYSQSKWYRRTWTTLQKQVKIHVYFSAGTKWSLKHHLLYMNFVLLHGMYVSPAEPCHDCCCCDNISLWRSLTLMLLHCNRLHNNSPELLGLFDWNQYEQNTNLALLVNDCHRYIRWHFF